ncbi:MAG: DUF6190 family protein [Nocardiopsaceae bacterium]|jgi:hypothetical protein|nr:DUF6190 family protein [Nocardiopsaceae bacterium]
MPGEPHCIDAALFLGMNCEEEPIRLSCKAFVAARFRSRLVLCLEQVGRCDDLVWGYPRMIQDAYYPFMDALHTVMDVERPGYTEADLRCGLESPAQLPMHERSLLGLVRNRGGSLTTVSPRLLGLENAAVPVHAPEPARGAEPTFPSTLERLYQRSLALRIPKDVL